MTTRSRCGSFRNRTYVFPSRSFYLNPNGLRTANIRYLRWNTTTGLFELAWYYESLNRKLIQRSAIAMDWITQWPPRDVPLCGFAGDLCLESSSSKGLHC